MAVAEAAQIKHIRLNSLLIYYLFVHGFVIEGLQLVCLLDDICHNPYFWMPVPQFSDILHGKSQVWWGNWFLLFQNKCVLFCVNCIIKVFLWKLWIKITKAPFSFPGPQEINSRRFLIFLEHQYSRRNVTWKRSIFPFSMTLLLGGSLKSVGCITKQ